MTSKTFVSGTVVDSAWLNDVDKAVYRKLAGWISVKEFGAVGDGVTDDTAAIQSAINALSDGQTLIFPPLLYKMGQAVFNGRNATVMSYGATFNLTGSNAGFLVKGTVINFQVYGGKIVGDNTNRDGALTTIQIGWSFGNEVSANVQNVIVKDVWVEKANIAFKFAAGTGAGSGPCYNVKISNCHAKDIVGTVGGNGYGFQFSQASYSSVVQCSADNCQRHGIYFAEGRDYTATDCTIKNHRSTVSTAAYRVAMSISRSRNVTVRGCVFDNCYDGTVEIDVDTQGTAPDNVSTGTVLANCVFLDSVLSDIRVGTSPLIDGVVRDVLITGCVMVRKAANAISSIVVEGAERLKITDCLIDASVSAATVRAISLNGTDGDAYTKDIEITHNSIYSANIGIQIPSATQLGTSRLRVLNNNIVATTAELEFLAGEDATTNNNLIYNRTNGKNATKTCTTTGANITVPVGGIDVLAMSPSAALSILQFSGAVEGQVLMLFFTNSNTTLLNTNIYTAGAVNFVSTANDVVTLIYRSGAWREQSRSLN